MYICWRMAYVSGVMFQVGRQDCGIWNTTHSNRMRRSWRLRRFYSTAHESLLIIVQTRLGTHSFGDEHGQGLSQCGLNAKPVRGTGQRKREDSSNLCLAQAWYRHIQSLALMTLNVVSSDSLKNTYRCSMCFSNICMFSRRWMNS